jgi:hypothetical protein
VVAPLAESVAVTVTALAPEPVRVPEMIPEPGSIVKPSGRPVALYTTVEALLLLPTATLTLSPVVFV